MYIELSKEQIEELKESRILELISLWDRIDTAQLFYSCQPGYYTSYMEKPQNITYATSTPVKVYKFNSIEFILGPKGLGNKS